MFGAAESFLILPGRFRMAALLAATTLAFPLMSACTPASEPQNPWCGEIESAIAELPADSFQRQALSDCKVTDDEFMQALNDYKTCMSDHGYPVKFQFEGGRYLGREVDVPAASTEEYSQEAAKQFETQNEQCDDNYLTHVEFYYVEMKSNPNNIDPTLEIIGCMQRRGIVDANYTPEQFNADLEDLAGTFGADAAEVEECMELGAEG